MPQESAIMKFVAVLFEKIKDPTAPDTRIRREDNTLCRITFVEINGLVQLFMDGQDMGHFEPWDRQGYTYAFFQKLRRGMHAGYTPDEAMLMSLCEHHPEIRLFRALD